jgi:hypothetical protein
MAKMPLSDHDNVAKALPDRTAGANRRKVVLTVPVQIGGIMSLS